MTTTVERPVIGVDDEQARLVVFALLDAAGGEPAVEVSQAVLAQSTGLDRRTLRRVLDRLEAAGWMGVERPATPNSPAVYGIAGLAQTCRDVGLTPPAPASPAVVERGPRVLSRQEATHPLDHVVEGARYLVNPEYLQAGENVRRDLRAGKGFLETVRAHGVVKDIDVYVTLTGLVVLDGHRRLDAALALHLESVPVRVVRVDDEAERIASQLMVNDEAEHCNSAERADAIQQLVLLGVPAQDLRRRGIRGEEVAAARAVASAPEAVRQAAFQVVSLATTTGYAATDYLLWPTFVPVLMLFLGCFVSCAGSTGGGIKLVRMLVLVRLARRELVRIIHPRVVHHVTLGRGGAVSPDVIWAIMAFMLIYGGAMTALTLLMLASGLDVVTAFSAVIACLNNIGPGMGKIGPAGNFGVLNDFQITICTFAMLLGRLELLSVLVLLTPQFWRS